GILDTRVHVSGMLAMGDHQMPGLDDASIEDLHNFVQFGVSDIAPFIDADTKEIVGGDAEAGASLYADTCTTCHGDDGRELNFGSDDEPEYVGEIARDNPWEFFHKVRFGQPGTEMPAVHRNGWSMEQVR